MEYLLIIRQFLPGISSHTKRIGETYSTVPFGEYFLNSNGTITIICEATTSKIADIVQALSEYTKITNFGDSLQIYINHTQKTIHVAFSMCIELLPLPKMKDILSGYAEIAQNCYDEQVESFKEKIKSISLFTDWKQVSSLSEIADIIGRDFVFDMSIFTNDHYGKKYGCVLSINNIDQFNPIRLDTGEYMTVISCRRLLEREMNSRIESVNKSVEINESVWSDKQKKNNQLTRRVHTINNALARQIAEQIHDLWTIDVSCKLQNESVDGLIKSYREIERYCAEKNILLYTHGFSAALQLQSFFPGAVDKNQHLYLSVGAKIRKLISGYITTS